MLHDFIDTYLVIFIDDILVYGNTIEELYERLELVLQRLGEFGLYVHPEKSKFFLTQVAYLGLGLTHGGTFIMDHRKKAIDDWPIPTAQDKTGGQKGVRTGRGRDGKVGIRSSLVSFGSSYLAMLKLPNH